MTRPHVNPAIRFFADGAGYLAYNSETDSLHELNAVASLIFELCDGSRTTDEILALASSALPVNSALQHFFSEDHLSGLLVSAASDAVPVAPREFTAEELSTLVEHLCETGQPDAALRCAKKLTQVAGADPATWHTLGRIARLAGRRTLAADAYERYLAACPEDASIAHLLVALRDEPPPPRASDDCVRLTFADFASHYDTKMRDNLGYQAPERLAEFIRAELCNSSALSILDIGCGTGLAGETVKPCAAQLTGIDLSPEMIKRARDREIYDSLEVAEITEWLARASSAFDLIIACDCLVYFGDLSLVAQLVAARLEPGGHFAFTVERGDIYPFHLTDSGRYTHHRDHILSVAAQSGLRVGRLEAGFLRTEAGLDVIGLFALLRKPSGS
ncbi:MAG TPA: methyltransferase [Silvibacterium sp.]|nr:methyltransferase [Silvibacterium sp.]